MVHWVEDNTLVVVYGFLLWTLLLSPLWRRLRRRLRQLEDLLDPETPGGLGDVEERLKRLEDEGGL